MPEAQWLNLYSDPNDASKFQKWLQLILNKGNISLRESYKNSRLHRVVGLFTFRFLKPYTFCWERILYDLKTKEDVRKHYNDNFFLDQVLKSENLQEEILTKSEDFSFDRKNIEKVIDILPSKTNVSQRKKDFRY